MGQFGWRAEFRELGCSTENDPSDWFTSSVSDANQARPANDTEKHKLSELYKGTNKCFVDSIQTKLFNV